MEPYAVYGHFYDATQAVPDGAAYRRLLQRHHPGASSLLEIGCGTGAHLLPLARHYAVEGLDISPTMLRYARKRLPAVRFHRQNMAGFALDARFDAVVCPYDSINHLLTYREWERTFRAARRHLTARGVFIVDINTEHRLQRLAKAPAWVHQFDGNYLIMKVQLASGISSWDIKVFERETKATYRLHREVIRERAFAHERVRRTLEKYFGQVWTYDAAGWSRPKARSERLFYVCQK